MREKKDCTVVIRGSLGFSAVIVFSIGEHVIAEEQFMTDASEGDIRPYVEEWGEAHLLPPEQVEELIANIQKLLAKAASGVT